MSETNPDFVIDVTAATFKTDVLEASFSRPVVVDFWAPWCAPCRTLGPVLEALAREYAGKFLLAKADTEALPEVAARFGVRSIPAVYGFRDGKVVDAFVGALPEGSIRTWLGTLLPTPAEEAAAAARALEATDPAAAEAGYRDALGHDPRHAAARAGLARVLLHQGRVDEARDQVATLEGRGYLEPEAEAVKAEIALHALASSSGGVDASRAALAADPGNPALRLTHAEALAASGQYDEALELALALVEERPKSLGDEPKRLMLSVFPLLPADSDLVAEYRRKLSAALY